MNTVVLKLVAVEIWGTTAISYNQIIDVRSLNQLLVQLKLSFQNVEFFWDASQVRFLKYFFEFAWAVIKTHVITFDMSFHAGTHALSNINEAIGICLR